MRSPAHQSVERSDYERVLVPYDGSKGSRRGVEQAFAIAEQSRAAVHVLHVVDEQVVGSTPALSSDELALDKHHERGKQLVETIAAEADRRGVETTCSCIRGIPHEEIRAYAETHDIDLIVMGVHGDSGDSRPHIGGTIDRVMRADTVPVLPV